MGYMGSGRDEGVKEMVKWEKILISVTIICLTSLIRGWVINTCCINRISYLEYDTIWCLFFFFLKLTCITNCCLSSDPANENVEYTPDIDVAQLIKLGENLPFKIT